MERWRCTYLLRAGAWLLVLATVPGLGGCIRRGPERPPNLSFPLDSNGARVAFDHAGTVLAAGTVEGVVRLWRTADGKPFGRWQADADSITGLAFVHDDQWLATAGYDGVLTVWTVTGRRLRRIKTPAPVTALAADPSRSVVVTGHRDGQVRIWSVARLQPRARYPLHAGSVRALAVDAGGGRIAAATAGGRTVVLSRNGGVRDLARAPGSVWSLAFSPDGAVLMGGGWFHLYRWDLRTGNVRTLATPHRGMIRALDYSPDGRSLATISRQTDSAVYLLDPLTGRVQYRFRSHDLCGADVRFSPDGRYVASTSDDATVQVWDLRHLLPAR